jgi:hypothetical protein
MRCGCFQGDQLTASAGTKSLKGLKKKLFTLPARIVFEMKILACTDDRLDIDFHHSPLVAAHGNPRGLTMSGLPCFATSPCRETGASPAPSAASLSSERRLPKDLTSVKSVLKDKGRPNSTTNIKAHRFTFLRLLSTISLTNIPAMLSKRHNIFIRAYHGKTGFILAFAIIYIDSGGCL